MCSILGYVNTKLSLKECGILNLSMSRRGPDNSSVKKYRFRNQNLYLGHNRLSIQDLATHANQPMENEHYVIVFNGEIYNHLELRTEFACLWHTHSDTETLLSLFTQFGIEKTISKLIGMFAIGLFDKKADKLYLIRDRVGIKPLYWTYQNNEFAFSSELKGFAKHLKQKTSNKALIQFMSFGYIPNDNSYYEEIHKLPGGHYLIFDTLNVTIKRYWDLPDSKLTIHYEEAQNEAERLIRSSIKYRLLADVKVGSFLSGGVDSSLVSTLMQQESNAKIKTFSIGFEDKQYDESVYAKKVADYIGSEHYEYIFRAQDVSNLLDDFDTYYDEPFGDASSLPMMLLSKMTKKHVTVALSGDGGDELFLGYDRYFFTQKYFTRLSKAPKALRNFGSTILKYSGQDKLEKMSYSMRMLSEENLYSLLYTSIKPWELNKLFTGDFLKNSFGVSDPTLLDLMEYKLDGENLLDSLSRLDFKRYLPDDILTKVDRASMAYGLEARVPLLDHRLVELAYSLPVDLKLRNGPKSILKDILYKYLPKDLTERPKKGFAVPLKYWFRNELKDRLFAKINSLDDRFNKAYLLDIAHAHIYKNKNYEYILWNIMRLK